MPPHLLTFVYWKEIDELIHHARATAHELFRKRASLAIGFVDDAPDVAALPLRQALEVAFWAASFMVGVAMSARELKVALAGRPRTLCVSPDIEGFVRGHFSPEHKRIEEGWKVLGRGAPAEFDDRFLRPADPTSGKMRNVAELIVKQAEEFGIERFEDDFNRVRSAYEYLCGLVHITPTLFAAVLPIPGDARASPPFDHLVATSLLSAFRVLHHTALDEAFDWISLLHDQHQTLPISDEVPCGVVKLEMPILRDLTEANYRVRMMNAEGDLFTVHKGNKRKRG